MKGWRILILCLVLSLVFLIPGEALAQTYLFSLDQLTVHVYWQEDGTASLAYEFIFTNDRSASPIDYIDVGLPNSNFNVNSISADVNGIPITDISRSGYQGDGVGVALGLGSNAIRPGETAVVHMYVGVMEGVIYTDTDDPNYVSAVFMPTWFGRQFVTGNTDMMVVFHLPPGVQTEEPRWHAAPAGWSQEPVTGMDEDGRIIYTWTNLNAQAYEEYLFGASFPAKYIPETTVTSSDEYSGEYLNESSWLMPIFCCGSVLFMGLIVFLSYRSTQKRRMQYLPPKIAIEGMGIKRGLTAIEAAILLEQPMDKILTMTLFSTIKKGAVEVLQKEPLKLKITSPIPEGLQEYETEFLKAFESEDKRKRRIALQDMMTNLVKSVSGKMKGFSRKETIAYYKDITERAWAQVEAAQTPEVKSEKYDELMDWTMLDKNYQDRTRDIFSGGPVYIPNWWGRFDPSFPRPASSPTASGGGTVLTSAPAGGSSSKPSLSLPTLPGSAFAASVANSVQDFSSNLVGNLASFTDGVTTRTNPIPISTSRPSGSFRGGSSSGGGSSCACACACACAGCACACAGGGR